MGKETSSFGGWLENYAPETESGRNDLVSAIKKCTDVGMYRAWRGEKGIVLSREGGQYLCLNSDKAVRAFINLAMSLALEDDIDDIDESDDIDGQFRRAISNPKN